MKNQIHDIMDQPIAVGDLICSTSGYRRLFNVRVVRKLTNETVMYYNIGTNKNDGYNLTCGKFDSNGNYSTVIQGLKISSDILTPDLKKK